MEDDGRPFEAGLQGQASNHLKRLWSNARVVSVEEKASKRCQVRIKKMSASEPRVTCRNVKDDIKTRGASRRWDERGRDLLTGVWCPAYTWHEYDPGLGVARGNLLYDAKRTPST
jgi:hypothetical protein